LKLALTLPAVAANCSSSSPASMAVLISSRVGINCAGLEISEIPHHANMNVMSIKSNPVKDSTARDIFLANFSD
jgi:hypothetical protein